MRLFRVLSLGMLISVCLVAADTGRYWVPGPDLDPTRSVFLLSDATVTTQGSSVFLHYTLPPELVQPDLQSIDLTGTRVNHEPFFNVSGGGNVGTCRVAAAGITCLVRYDFAVDEDQVLHYIALHHPQDNDLRAKIVRFFGNEPGGVVFFNSTLP